MLNVDKVINHGRKAGGVGHLCVLLSQLLNLSLKKSLSGKKPDLFVCQLMDNLDLNAKAKHARAEANKNTETITKNCSPEYMPEEHIHIQVTVF